MADLTGKVNRAIIYKNPGTTATEIVELPIQQPGNGEVLVRLLYSGVCHTDYGFCTNGFSGMPVKTPPGQVGGHEGIGEVISQGPGVTFPPIGSKVGIKYAADACLSCDICLEGGETTCPSVKVSGFYHPGTFQQYCVSSARYVTPIPEGVDLAAAAPLMCGGITVCTALNRVNVRPGQWVLICGAGGGLGHLAIQYAKAMGARVLAIDAGSKEKFCLDLGAEAFLDFSKFTSDQALADEVKKITAGGAKVVLMCASTNKAYAQAMSWLRFRGKLVCLGVPEGEAQPIGGAKVLEMIGMEQSIIAVKTGNRHEAKACLDFAARGLVKTHYELRPMDSLTQIFDEMEEGKINGRIVLDLR